MQLFVSELFKVEVGQNDELAALGNDDDDDESLATTI